MADFLPKNTPDPNAPNWTGASRQPSRGDYQSNKTFETLFSGIGDAVTGTVKAAYEGITEKIKTEWNEAVTPVRDAQGVGDTTDAATVNGVKPGGGGIPQAQAESFGERATKLTAAYRDGRIGDAYYYAQLNAMTKEFKSRFPGFRDEVDAVVQRSTGVVPANALRNAVLAKLQESTTAAQKAAQDEQKWVEGNMKYATPQQIDTFRRTGKMPTKAELAPHVYQAQKEEQETKETMAQLNLADKQGQVNQTQAVKATQGIIDTETSRIFDRAVNSIGGPDSLLMKAIAGGKPLSGPELEQVKGQIVLFKQQYQTMLDKIFEGSAEGGRSLGQMIGDPTKIKQLKDQAMEKVTRLEQLITDNNFGAAAMHANAIKYGRDKEVRGLLDRHDYFRNMDALGTLNGGKELMPLLMNRPGGEQVLNQGLQTLRDVFNVKTAAGNGDPKVEIEEARRAGAGPSYYKRMINDYSRMLAAKEVTPEIRANFVKSLMGDPTSIQNFKEKSKAFTMLTSPEITKRMMEIRDAGDTETWERYSTWAKNSFFQVFRQQVDNVKAHTALPWIDVAYNEKSNQFVITPSAQGMTDIAKFPASRGQNPLRFMMRTNSSIGSYIQSVDELNKSIRVLEPIMKADNYDDVGREMSVLFEARGFDPNAPKDASFGSKLWDAIKRGVKSLGDQEKPSEGISSSFGGEAVNFQSASGANQGKAGSQVSLEGSDISNRKGADIDNLEPRTRKFLEDLAAEGIVGKLEVNSGYRDPQRNARAGGAKGSQHINGLAVDLDVRGMTDEQKAAILEKAIAKGAKGVGIYPGGNAIHFDLREGSPATWGPSPAGRYKGVDWREQPAWAHGPLKKLFGQS